MNTIVELFKDVVVKRGGLDLHSKVNAIRFVQECYKNKISILGIDGFYITNDTIQPSIENSVDFTISSIYNDFVFGFPIDFLSKKDNELFFEIIYELI